MNKLDALNNIEQIFDNVIKTDDKIIKSAESLKIVLLNLKIENARIKEHTGIDPIADRLGVAIANIEDSVKDLVEKNRALLKESIEVLKGEE